MFCHILKRCELDVYKSLFINKMSTRVKWKIYNIQDNLCTFWIINNMLYPSEQNNYPLYNITQVWKSSLSTDQFDANWIENVVTKSKTEVELK